MDFGEAAGHLHLQRALAEDPVVPALVEVLREFAGLHGAAGGVSLVAAVVELVADVEAALGGLVHRVEALVAVLGRVHHGRFQKDHLLDHVRRDPLGDPHTVREVQDEVVAHLLPPGGVADLAEAIRVVGSHVHLEAELLVEDRDDLLEVLDRARVAVGLTLCEREQNPVLEREGGVLGAVLLEDLDHLVDRELFIVQRHRAGGQDDQVAPLATDRDVERVRHDGRQPVAEVVAVDDVVVQGHDRVDLAFGHVLLPRDAHMQCMGRVVALGSAVKGTSP